MRCALIGAIQPLRSAAVNSASTSTSNANAEGRRRGPTELRREGWAALARNPELREIDKKWSDCPGWAWSADRHEVSRREPRWSVRCPPRRARRPPCQLQTESSGEGSCQPLGL